MTSGAGRRLLTLTLVTVPYAGVNTLVCKNSKGIFHLIRRVWGTWQERFLRPPPLHFFADPPCSLYSYVTLHLFLSFFASTFNIEIKCIRDPPPPRLRIFFSDPPPITWFCFHPLLTYILNFPVSSPLYIFKWNSPYIFIMNMQTKFRDIYEKLVYTYSCKVHILVY